MHFMKIFDAHTHINFPAYDSDREAVIERARAVGVKMITVGTNLETSRSAIAVAEKYPHDIWATVGFHPDHIAVGDEWYHDKNETAQAAPEQFDAGAFRQLAAHPRVVAIGECGLDYFRIMNNELGIKERQREVFLQQVTIAQEAQKSLMIHCRPSRGTDDAYLDLVPIIHNSQFLIPNVVHFFVGSKDIAKKLLNLGCSFTFGGVITFVRDYDEVIKYIPLENILLETDAPYVTPEPYRSADRRRRNEPVYVVEVAKKMAEIRGIGVEGVVEQTTKNIERIFGFISNPDI